MFTVPSLTSTSFASCDDLLSQKPTYSSVISQPQPSYIPDSFSSAVTEMTKSLNANNRFMSTLLDTQKGVNKQVSEIDKLILERETALADLAKTTALNASIASHELSTRLNLETLQDQRKRTQNETDLEIRKRNIELDHLEAMNKFKVRDAEANSDHVRKIDIVKLTTNSQISLMETTSICNRNQSIFNNYGVNPSADNHNNDEKDD